MNKKELTTKLMKVMSKHIGKENSISGNKLFKKIYNVKPEDVEFYERKFLWDVILKLTSKLRSNNTLFIINNFGNLFVLKSNIERLDYHRIQDTRKQAIDHMKTNADIWVKEKMWKKFSQIKVKKS